MGYIFIVILTAMVCNNCLSWDPKEGRNRILEPCIEYIVMVKGSQTAFLHSSEANTFFYYMPVTNRVQISVACAVWSLPWNINVMLLFWQIIRFSQELPVKKQLKWFINYYNSVELKTLFHVNCDVRNSERKVSWIYYHTSYQQLPKLL